jgi:serine/threonine protein kinase
MLRPGKRFDPRVFDFLELLMELDPKKRATAGEALDHPWLMR